MMALPDPKSQTAQVHGDIQSLFQKTKANIKDCGHPEKQITRLFAVVEKETTSFEMQQ